MILLISIICVYNNESILNDWLIRSLSDQSAEFELILINNCDRIYKSAASALNYAGKKAIGDYFCFIHQDIHFCRKTDIENIEIRLSKLDNLGIAGMAGMSMNGNSPQQCQRNIIIEHDNPPKLWGNPIKEPEIVQTVDECLFIIPKKVFNLIPFDEVTCDNWHFYAVDYCLSLNSSVFKTYVIPFQIHHQSLGFSQKFKFSIRSAKELMNYYQSLKKILKKHKKNYKLIYTTNGIYKTNINPMVQDLKRIDSIIPSKIRRKEN